MMSFTKADGPACPKCDCCDAKVLRRYNSIVNRRETRRCSHCGFVFSAAVPRNEDEGWNGNAVTYASTLCPECKSNNTTITRVSLPIRYHVCRQCKLRFKSVVRP